MAITQLQNVQKFINNELSIGNESYKLLEAATITLKDPNDVISNPCKIYAGFCGKIARQLQVCTMQF